MPLELANFQVNKVVFGSTTAWKDGVLEIDADEIMGLAAADPYIEKVNIEIASPGDSTRIVNDRDVLEPKLKVDGPGVVYPGITGRPVNTVGQGRTNRLAGMTVMSCAQFPEVRIDGSRSWGRTPRYKFVDMSGPCAISPYAALSNVCIEMSTEREIDADTWNRSLQAALFKISDRLAETTRGLTPPEVEVIDLTPKPGLPGFVFIPMLASPEHRMGASSSMGTGVYGITRLTQPWFLDPAEMLDGAVAGTYGGAHVTWPLTNSIVLHMARGHGKEFNFLGCIPVRTNWESQSDKQLMANRAAQLAQTVGASGAIATTNVRGQRFAETVLTIQACERLGIKTVLLTEEEDDENGTASPMLIPVPELVSVVSNGTGSASGPFPAVDKVIGNFGDDSWAAEREPIHGRYGVSHTSDVYGFTRQSCDDY